MADSRWKRPSPMYRMAQVVDSGRRGEVQPRISPLERGWAWGMVMV